MNRLLVFLTGIFISLQCTAQDHRSEIAAHREAYLSGFTNDAHSPLKKEDLVHLHFFDADSTFKVTADAEILTGEKPFNMPTYDGTSKEFVRYARIRFRLNGQDLHLTLYRNVALAANPQYKDHLFLPFTDETNGQETYGGGRYIDLAVNDITDGRVTVDFNKAYNPYCAYSTGYRCPVPPRENDLPIEISAGEKAYTGDKKHRTTG